MSEWFLVTGPVLWLLAGATGLLLLSHPRMRMAHPLHLPLALCAWGGALFTARQAELAWPLEFATLGYGDSHPLAQSLSVSLLLDEGRLRWIQLLCLMGIPATLVLGEQLRARTDRALLLALTLVSGCGMWVMVVGDRLPLLLLGMELFALPTLALITRATSAPEPLVKATVRLVVAASLLFLGLSLIHLSLGTLSLTEIGRQLATAGEEPPLAPARIGLCLAFASLALFMGLFPFHGFLPDLGENTPAWASLFPAAVFSVGWFAVVVQFSSAFFVSQLEPWNSRMLVLGGALTFLVGAAAAARHTDLKPMLTYAALAQAGLYLGALPESGAEAAAGLPPLFPHLLPFALHFLGLFAMASLAESRTGSTDVAGLTGLGLSHPLLGLAMAVLCLSAAGLPPTAGFLAHFLVALNLIVTGQTLAGALALAGWAFQVSLFFRILLRLFSRESGERWDLRGVPLTYLVVVFCALATAVLFLSPPRVQWAPIPGEILGTR